MWRPAEARTAAKQRAASAPVTGDSIQRGALVQAPLTPPLVKPEQGIKPATKEDHWATALAEMEGGTKRQGVWAKTFAESDGDETQAKVAYLKARVQHAYGYHGRWSIAIS